MGALTAETIPLLTGRERLVLAIDTDTRDEAVRLSNLAKEVGAVSAKYGLEVYGAMKLSDIAEISAEAELEWIADLKLQFGEEDNVERVIEIVKNLEHPPFAITIHTQNELSILQRAARAAGETILFGVTALTSIKDGDKPGQSLDIFGKKRAAIVPELAATAVLAGLPGLVCSAREVKMVKSNPETSELIILSPGSRSKGAITHDQGNPETPDYTIAQGADLLVIGRQVSEAPDQAAEFQRIAEEADEGMSQRMIDQ